MKIYEQILKSIKAR